MIKEKEVQRTLIEPEYIECDRCHKKIHAEDCPECIYNEMVSITKYSEDSMTEFHLCHECFDEIVKKESINANVITNDPMGEV